ncbi:hypothetical protein B0T19DRAFT_440946 [Cercophora scortea]|uniref:Uncharacterized protein n=1 Tax=Cercophora scortea TaxID=314031 RepID=A0AAE0IKP3_9PEZI|nr:hypothetical protein B0T19DRAFT_440946 [Cercophora scortea]
MASHSTIPSDHDVVQAVAALRKDWPELGRAKLLTQLKQAHNWSLSEARLKKLVSAAAPQDTRTSTIPIPGTLRIPRDALAAQQRYRDKSMRCFKIYGRGEYDYGVTPNADRSILINVMHDRLVKAGRPETEVQKRRMFPTLRVIYEYYAAAAEIAGVSKDDVAQQLEAEYGLNPMPYLMQIPAPTPEQVAERKAKFKKQSLAMMRIMLVASEEARNHIPVDDNDDPIWDEERNGEFCLMVVKIDKGDGLTEHGLVNELN